LCKGNYTLTVKDLNNCVTKAMVNIPEPTPVYLSTVPSSTICAGSSTILSANVFGGNGGLYSFTWTPSTALSGFNSQIVTASPTSSIVYTVVAADAFGCLSQKQTVSVTSVIPVELTVNSNTAVCFGQSVSLYSNATNGSGNSYNYSWLPQVGLINPNSQNPIATPSVTTVYSVTVNDQVCSMPVVKHVTVTVMPLPIVTFSGSILSGCAPLCVNFTNLSSTINSTLTSYNWSFDTDQSTDVNPLKCFSKPGNYNISLTATTFNGCVSSYSLANYINVFSNPVADFNTPNSIASGYDVQFIDNSIDANSWYWAFDGDNLSDNNTSTNQNPIHYFQMQV